MPKLGGITAQPIIIRYDGLFDFQGLYELMINWFKRYRFWVHEITYKHKVPTPLGAEQEMEWECRRKVTAYYQVIFDVWMKLWEMTEVEVVVDGKKKILTKARIEIRLDADLELDYQKRFEKSAFARKLRDFLNNVVVRKSLESEWADPWNYRLYHLHALIKKYLDMQAQWYEYAGYIGDER